MPPVRKFSSSAELAKCSRDGSRSRASGGVGRWGYPAARGDAHCATGADTSHSSSATLDVGGPCLAVRTNLWQAEVVKSGA